MHGLGGVGQFLLIDKNPPKDDKEGRVPLLAE